MKAKVCFALWFVIVSVAMIAPILSGEKFPSPAYGEVWILGNFVAFMCCVAWYLITSKD